jgi:hypothetical protein
MLHKGKTRANTTIMFAQVIRTNGDLLKQRAKSKINLFSVHMFKYCDGQLQLSQEDYMDVDGQAPTKTNVTLLWYSESKIVVIEYISDVTTQPAGTLFLMHF